MGRHRIEPDPNTWQGQWALWFARHLPDGKTADELAKDLGISRASFYNYLSGFKVPNIEQWADIAEYCGLKADAWELAPPREFVAYVKRHGAAKYKQWKR